MDNFTTKEILAAWESFHPRDLPTVFTEKEKEQAARSVIHAFPKIGPDDPRQEFLFRSMLFLQRDEINLFAFPVEEILRPYGELLCIKYKWRSIAKKFGDRASAILHEYYLKLAVAFGVLQRSKQTNLWRQNICVWFFAKPTYDREIGSLFMALDPAKLSKATREEIVSAIETVSKGEILPDFYRLPVNAWPILSYDNGRILVPWLCDPNDTKPIYLKPVVVVQKETLELKINPSPVTGTFHKASSVLRVGEKNFIALENRRVHLGFQRVPGEIIG